MRDYQTYMLPTDFSFTCKPSRDKLVLSDVVHQEVEEIWKAEQHRKEQLFNGEVLSLIDYHQQGLTAEFVEYKHFLAYVRAPHLRKALGIKPLSLSCITRTSRAVLIGRRASMVTQYPLWYELAPSGGIDRQFLLGDNIDILGQAYCELTEETNYQREDVQKAAPFALVHDPISGIYEVCVEFILSPNKDQQIVEPTQEYDTLDWILNADVPEFVRSHQHRVVPISLYLLQLRHLFTGS